MASLSLFVGPRCHSITAFFTAAAVFVMLSMCSVRPSVGNFIFQAHSEKSPSKGLPEGSAGFANRVKGKGGLTGALTLARQHKGTETEESRANSVLGNWGENGVADYEAGLGARAQLKVRSSCHSDANGEWKTLLLPSHHPHPRINFSAKTRRLTFKPCEDTSLCPC